MTRTLFTCMLISIFGFLYATPHSTITLKNGTVVNGDIIAQRYGKDITVEAENAEFIINPKDITSKKTRRVKYENLSREMKRWVLENKALKGDAYGRYAELEDIQTKKNTYIGLLKSLQNGNEVYIQVSPATLNLKWDDIQTIDKIISNGIKYNLIDIVTTITGKTYEGKIISQKTGESITIATSMARVTIPNKDIKEIRKSLEKASNNPFNEIDFINTIVLKDGKEKEGLISTQHYGNKANDNYITLLDKSGKSEVILISTISEQRTKFDKQDAFVYKPGKMYINEFMINKALTQRISNNIVFLDKQIFPFPEGIGITFKTDGLTLTNGWSLIALSELPISGGKTSWGYNIEKKQENIIPCSPAEQTSAISHINYGYLSPGFYALVNDSDTEAFVFKITK